MSLKKPDMLEVFDRYPNEMEMLLREPSLWVEFELEKLCDEDAPIDDFRKLQKIVKDINKTHWEEEE